MNAPKEDKHFSKCTNYSPFARHDDSSTTIRELKSLFDTIKCDFVDFLFLCICFKFVLLCYQEAIE